MPNTGTVLAQEALTVSTTAESPGLVAVALPALAWESETPWAGASLRLRADLPMGTEVQLWHTLSLDDAPWDDEAERRSALVALWMLDARTGTEVRLDVSGYLARRARAPEVAGDLVLRAVGPEGDPVVLEVGSLSGIMLVGQPAALRVPR